MRPFWPMAQQDPYSTSNPFLALGFSWWYKVSIEALTFLSCFLLSQYVVVKKTISSHSHYQALQKQRELSIPHSHYPILISPAGHCDLPGIPEQKVNSPQGLPGCTLLFFVISGDLCKLFLRSVHSNDWNRAVHFLPGKQTQGFQVKGDCHLPSLQLFGNSSKLKKLLLNENWVKTQTKT